MVRERKKKEIERNDGVGSPKAASAFLPRVGPTCPADNNGGTRMLWLCLPLALQAIIVVLVMISSFITSSIDGRRRSTTTPSPSVSYDMANRSRIAWESSHTVPPHLALLETWVSRYSQQQPLVTSRCLCLL
jgi:hypothetical protein